MDLDRLQGLLKWAEEEDALRREGKLSHWNQGEWILWDEQGSTDLTAEDCGTVCCIAGKVALEEGARDLLASPVVVSLDGEYTAVRKVAQTALGLTTAQADVLFDGGNDLDDLRAIVGWLTEGLDGNRIYALHRDRREGRGEIPF